MQLVPIRPGPTDQDAAGVSGVREIAESAIRPDPDPTDPTIGMRGFYCGRGRWVHGPQFRYPALRFAGISEEKLAPHLYLKWDSDRHGNDSACRQPRLVAKHAHTTLAELVRAQDPQPDRRLPPSPGTTGVS